MKSEKAVASSASVVLNPGAVSLTQADLQVLKAPFAKDSLGVKVQSLSKDRNRAMLVLYLQHTDVQNRLEEVDPAWTCEVLAEERTGDTVYVRTRMVVKGVSRENVGEGSDPKSAYSDALKRCAMLFGVGRYLYDSVTVWSEYNESRDRFKQWSIVDYERASRGQAYVPSPEVQSVVVTPTPSGESPVKPKVTAKASTKGPTVESGPPAQPGLKTESPGAKSRDQYNRVLMNLYRPYLTKFPETRFVELLYGRYNVGETRLMTIDQMEDLVHFMEKQLQTSEAQKASATA